MEAKALTCNVVPGRLPHGQAFAEFLNKYAPQADPSTVHPEQLPLDAAKGGEKMHGHANEGKT
jgi:hypothetical protein